MLHPSVYWYRGEVVPWGRVPLRLRCGSVLAFGLSGLAGRAVSLVSKLEKGTETACCWVRDGMLAVVDWLHGENYRWHRVANGTANVPYAEREKALLCILFPDPAKVPEGPKRLESFLGLHWALWGFVAVFFTTATYRCHGAAQLAFSILGVVAWVGTVLALIEASWGGGDGLMKQAIEIGKPVRFLAKDGSVGLPVGGRVTMPTALISEPALTVISKNGTRYSANHLATCYREGRYCLSFICSGELVTLEAQEVDRIYWQSDGRSHCTTCDSRLTIWPSAEHPPMLHEDRHVCRNAAPHPASECPGLLVVDGKIAE